MIPMMLNEINPKKQFYSRRVYNNSLLRIKTFFSPTMGYFDVLKMWDCVEYIWSSQNTEGSHWFHYDVVEIRTWKGEKFKLRRDYLEREGAFSRRIMNASALY